MKILMTAGSPRWFESGTSAVLYNMGRELTALGHQVDFLFREDLVSDNEMRGRFRETKFAWRLAKHIRRHAKEYDIANLHAPVGFVYGILQRLFPKKQGPPYVVSLHALEEWRTHAMKREDRKGRAWHFNWKNRAWQRVYNQSRFDYSVRTADAAHSFCRDVWTLLHLKYDLDPERILYVQSGVDARFFIQRNYEDRRPLRLLYVGTWLDQRGIFYLRDALNHMLGNFTDWTMTFAGVVTPEETIRNFFGDRLQKHLQIIYKVPAAEMPQLYSQHDVLLLPSLMEGPSFAVMEAMASGMPVITTETCGMVDSIEDGVDGLLIPTANADAIEQAVLRLARSPELRSSLGKAAQIRMRRRSWAEYGKKVEALFQFVLDNHRAAEKQK
ncbi:MAG: glycosyltransferase family 4 protein [Acidobacteria bacterium]|nr:glycosyltransferase family 4 protein [Acidobacteriota bacterium]MBS1865480.1 glycosyltransferase family 4 protein [Acidobacteriota bacterium]